MPLAVSHAYAMGMVGVRLKAVVLICKLWLTIVGNKLGANSTECGLSTYHSSADLEG